MTSYGKTEVWYDGGEMGVKCELVKDFLKKGESI